MPKLTHPLTGETVFASEAGARVLLARWKAGPAGAVNVQRPAPQAPRADWDAYAAAVGLDPSEFTSKAKLIEAINTGRVE